MLNMLVFLEILVRKWGRSVGKAGKALTQDSEATAPLGVWDYIGMGLISLIVVVGIVCAIVVGIMELRDRIHDWRYDRSLKR